jgi:hypothetical protein
MQNPGLQSMVDLATCDSYAEACLDAADETGLPRETFPPACPWTPEQVLGADFFPEAPLEAPSRP